MKSSQRVFWKHVHNNLGHKPHIVAVESAGGSLTGSDADTANVLSSYFASVFTSEENSCYSPLPNRSQCILENVNFSEIGILSLLRSLPSYCSAGPDGLPNELFSKASDVLCKVLKRFFRYLFDEGTLPKDWCLAHITPVFKKGNRTLCSNYRQISLTSTCCKVAERIVKNNILAFITENNLQGS